MFSHIQNNSCTMKTFKMFPVLFSSIIVSNKIYFDLTSVIIRDYEVFRATGLFG